MLSYGNKFEQLTDFETPGPNKLSFLRTYNGKSPQLTGLGIGWRSNFHRHFTTAWQDTERTVTRSDGWPIFFRKVGGLWVPGAIDEFTTMVEDAGGNIIVTYPDRMVDVFDSSKRLSTIRYPNGYEQTIDLDANGWMIGITDSHGRQLGFTNEVLASGNGRLAAVTLPDGRQIKFVYGDAYSVGIYPSQDRLEEVIYPDDTPLDDSDNPRVQYLYEDARFPYALTGIVDENGERFATWAYDDDLHAILTEHAGGADRFDIVYDEVNLTRTVTNALGKQTVYHFATIAGRNKVVRKEELASPTSPARDTYYTYNASGLRDSMTDPDGNVTTYEYSDPRGLETKRTEALGTLAERVITTNWHSDFRAPWSIRVQGRMNPINGSRPTHHLERFEYDAAGRVKERTVFDVTPLGVLHGTPPRTWTYTYTAEGLLDTVDGPRTDVVDVTDYDYDAAGNLTLVTSPLGLQTQMTAHDGAGRPLTIVDANGVATDLAYDPRGRLISRMVDPGPEQAVTTFGYDSAGNLTSVTLPDGETLAYVYDAARRLTEVRNGLGEKIVYTLDAEGNRTKEEVFSATAALQRTQSRVFDDLGRLLQEVGAASQTTTYAYDLNDNLASVTDPVGAVTQYAYDALNRLVATTDHLQGETGYAYETRDNLIRVDDPRGVATTYLRNGFGEVYELRSPDTGVTAYEIDTTGNRVKRTDSEGVVTEYTYDAGNRLMAKRFPASPAEDVTYFYDDPTPGRHGIGRLTRVEDASGWTELSYGPRGNVTLERRNVGGVAYDTTYSYDLADRLAEMVYPSGRIVTYQRDSLGRVSAVTTRADAAAPQVTLADNNAYLPFGPLAALDYGNGQARDLVFDLDYRLTDLDTTDGFTPVQDLSYGHDPAGNITAITDNLDLTRDQGFAYDLLHRLTQANGLYGQIDYAYDATGNRTGRTLTNGTTLVETYFNDLLSNRLTSLDRSDATSRTLAYNNRGDTTRDTRPDGSVFDFSYDSSGRLAVAAQNGTAVANARYNARGERVARIAGGKRMHSLYDTSGQLLAEYDAGAAIPGLVPPASQTTIDNTDPGAGTSGSWTNSTANPGYLGGNYALSHGGVDSDSFTWSPDLPDVGSYEVFARWPADPDLGSLATYTVHDVSGATPITVDQRATGDQWVSLGTFERSPNTGIRVELSGKGEPLSGPAEVVVDNLDPATTAVGTWNTSSAPWGGTFWDSNWMYRAAGTGANTFTWPAAVQVPGRYKIYARWTHNPNRATNAPYTITHAGGATTLRVNQEVNGGIWVYLGSYDLDPAAGHGVLLSDDANEFVIADAIKYVRDESALATDEIVVDNSDAALIGTWTTLVWKGGGYFWGSDTIYHAAGSGANSVTWTPAIPTTGQYRVYARWTSHPNRATNAPYTVHHAAGATTIRVNQEVGGGEWVPLGTFEMAPGQDHRVVLTDDADQFVIADAVKFVHDAKPLAGDQITVDNLDPQAYATGAWTSDSTVYAARRFWGTDLQLADPGDGIDSVFTWSLEPEPGLYNLYVRWTGGDDRATNARYIITYTSLFGPSSKEVTVNQQQNAGVWVNLGSFEFEPNAGHQVRLTDVGANGLVAADAVMLVRNGNFRQVAADAVKVESRVLLAGDFGARGATVLREYVTLDGRPLALIEGGQIRYVHPDHLGTPQKMTDSNGALVWDAVYRPFGEAESITGSASNPQRFPGQLYDPETGFHYNYFRDYAPELGRYVESDPIGLDGGLSTYSYVEGNPLTLTDSFGLNPQSAECQACLMEARATCAASMQDTVSDVVGDSETDAPKSPSIIIGIGRFLEALGKIRDRRAKCDELENACKDKCCDKNKQQCGGKSCEE